MGEKGQSDRDVSLRYHCTPELVVPKYDGTARATDVNNIIFKTLSKEDFSKERTNPVKNVSKVSPPPSSEAPIGAKLVNCSYKVAGCTVRIPEGLETEKEHCQSCHFRPIPCLMQHVCQQLLPYHAFCLHLMSHYICPTFSRHLSTTVFFDRRDFDCNQRWQPRWLSCYDKDFFVMIMYNIPGMWYFWVWVLGTPEEATDFLYDIEVSKSLNRKIGTFPVLSIRQTEKELEKGGICLTMTDYQMKKISQISGNIMGTFDLKLMIIQKSSSSASRLWV